MLHGQWYTVMSVILVSVQCDLVIYSLVIPGSKLWYNGTQQYTTVLITLLSVIQVCVLASSPH